MRAADCVHSRFGKAEVFYFAFGDQVLDRTSYVFDRYLWVDTMLIKEVEKHLRSECLRDVLSIDDRRQRLRSPQQS